MRFPTYILNEKGAKEVREFRAKMRKTVEKIQALLEDGHDAWRFQQKMDEAVFYAARSIASKLSNHNDVI